MNMLRISGIVISAGFVLYVAAMVVSPRLYQEPVIANRVAIIAEKHTRWIVSQLFFGLGMALPAAGILLLAISQRDTPIAWLYYLGAAFFAAGSLIGMWLVYRQTLDPVAFWEGVQIPLIIGYGFLLLTLVGMLCVGIAMLQGGFPSWVGYMLAGSAVIFMVAMLFSRGEGGFFISVLIYLVYFIAGIVILRQLFPA